MLATMMCYGAICIISVNPFSLPLFSRFRMPKRLINILVSIAVAAALLLFVVFQNGDRLSLESFANGWKVISAYQSQWLLLGVVVLLMPLNLFLEAIKWKVILTRLYPLHLTHAVKAVLSGMAAGLLLPNRIGDFAGKAMSLPRNFFWKGSLLAMFLSLTQLLVTTLTGMGAMFFFGLPLISVSGLPVWLLAVCVAMVLAALIFLFFSVQNIRFLFREGGRLRKITDVFSTISLSVRMKILAISVFRYIVFTLQNYLLLRLFGFDFPVLHMLYIIALMYLLMAIIPTMAITELPARGSVLLLVFMLYSEMYQVSLPVGAEASILYISLLVWLLNLVIPSLPGMYLLSKFTLRGKSKA